ncbi:hypothetical protein L2E82_51296 [Cichorium intybus]|nr:hypothetical protein L2E82_51296 [Cichorium intybus]
MLYRLHSIHHTSHSCILIVHFLDRFQSHNGLQLLGSSFISDFRFNCRSRVLTSLQLHRLQVRFVQAFTQDYGEVMDPSMDETSDDVPVNEPVPTTVEFEESSHASSQVIQSEEQFDDEVQSPQEQQKIEPRKAVAVLFPRRLMFMSLVSELQGLEKGKMGVDE